jgi:hypothetical protein
MPFLSPRSLTKSLALLAILCATACQAGAPGSAHSAGRAGEALQFERLMVGSVFGIGSHFESDGRSFTVESFGEGLGNAEVVNLAPRTQAKEQAPAVKALRLAHAKLRISGKKASGVEFDFLESGAQVAIEVAGIRRSAEDFIALDGARLGEVTVSVSESNTAGRRSGHLRLSGPISEMAISGTDLVLVDLRIAR